MSMTITPRDVGDVTILECAGRITLGEASSFLRDSIRQQLRLGRNRLILLLDGIGYFDSSGVGELVSGFTVVTNCGGALKLLSPSPRMRDCLQITKLYTVFEIYDDEAAAVESFNRPSFSFDCPVCRSRVRAYDSGDMVSREIACGICDLEFALAPVIPAIRRLAVSSLKLRSYYAEGVTLLSGQPIELRIAGRLDLFSSSPLKKVWR
ncbi:MAG: STAS domain-containing protein [Paludibaculum sp.]